MDNLPDRFFRGIAQSEYIIEGVVNESAFQLDPVREDGYCELSITWDEEEESINIIMNQINERTSNYQFPCGVCFIDKKVLRSNMKEHFINKRLDYEKNPTESNKYHGNLLIRNDIGKQMQRLIRFGLATIAGGNIIPNPNVK